MIPRTLASRTRALAMGVGLLVACGAGPAPSPAPTPTTALPTSPLPSSSAPSTAASSSPGPAVTPTARAATPAPKKPSCARLAAGLSLDEQVGQLLMVGISSTGLSDSVADTVADVHAGSTILLGNSTLGVRGSRRVTDAVRRAGDQPRSVSMLVAADQEGGLVQRLQGAGFTRIPAATVQAERSDRRLTTDAARWGGQLRQAGIDANLAPVADVVPSSLTRVNAPIGQLRRGYGADPETVAEKVTAFARGMDEAGVVTAVKHFPGLGRVRGNTDFTASVVDRVTTRNDPALAGFDAAIKADTGLVMVSSAVYSKIDRRRRAAFSPVVIQTMLREDRKFTGVVISDDLSAAAMRDLRPSERALRFVRAGGDLAIVGDPTQARSMAAGLAAEAKQDRKFARRVIESATRVLALKADAGLASC